MFDEELKVTMFKRAIDGCTTVTGILEQVKLIAPTEQSEVKQRIPTIEFLSSETRTPYYRMKYENSNIIPELIRITFDKIFKEILRMEAFHLKHEYVPSEDVYQTRVTMPVVTSPIVQNHITGGPVYVNEWRKEVDAMESKGHYIK